MNERFVNAIVRASIAWWRWSLRLVQSFMRRMRCPSRPSIISVMPNCSYFFQFSSCITSTSCQSSRRRSVIEPVVGTTKRTNSSKISRAFLAMYCESRKSRLMKPLGMSTSFISSLSRLVLLIFPSLYKLSIRVLYSPLANSSPYFEAT